MVWVVAQLDMPILSSKIIAVDRIITDAPSHRRLNKRPYRPSNPRDDNNLKIAQRKE
jgi:hypothetical protein